MMIVCACVRVRVRVRVCARALCVCAQERARALMRAGRHLVEAVVGRHVPRCAGGRPALLSLAPQAQYYHSPVVIIITLVIVLIVTFCHCCSTAISNKMDNENGR